MNILITGGSGFIGKSCIDYFINKYNIFTPSHQELDICDLYKLQKYIDDNNIEYIIHTAAKSGRKNKLLTAESVYYGLLMFENIIYAGKDCSRIINFGSGAELGEYPIKSIDLKNEDDIYNIITPECGGFVKSIMTKRILTLSVPECINLRIAGCFGIHEKNDRFIKNNLYRTIQNMSIQIYQNQYMDFIYVKDLANIIDIMLTSPISYKDINCVYLKKYTLLDIAHIIQDITNTSIPIDIHQDGMNPSYTLDGTRLSKLNIQLIGLENGIRDMYKDIINS